MTPFNPKEKKICEMKTYKELLKKYILIYIIINKEKNIFIKWK